MPIVFNVKIAISLIFAAATLACHFTSSRHVFTVRLPSCPRRALAEGWRRRFGVSGSKHSTNENETKFDYQINNSYEKFESSIPTRENNVVQSCCAEM